MKKDEYLIELRKRLTHFSAEEVEDALSYCEEYFDEAGEGNEEQILADLGSPAKFAAQLKAEKSIRQEHQQHARDMGRRKNSSLKNAGMIILGICAMPIALPLLIALLALIFALIVTVLALGIAGIASFAGIFFSGLPLLVSAVYNYQEAENAWIAAGGGLLCIGLGLLLSILFFHLIHAVLPVFTRALTRLYNKAKGGKHHEAA